MPVKMNVNSKYFEQLLLPEAVTFKWQNKDCELNHLKIRHKCNHSVLGGLEKKNSECLNAPKYSCQNFAINIVYILHEAVTYFRST